MSAIKSSPVKNQNEVPAPMSDEQKLAIATEFKAKNDRDSLAFYSQTLDFLAQGANLSWGALSVLAANLGKNSKVGRPTYRDEIAFKLAIGERPLSHGQCEELARIANKSVPAVKGEAGKPVFAVTAKRSDNKGAQSWKMNSSAMSKDFVTS
jgi:hypothetical protein